MGGAAFASGPDPLYTPRMPPSVYREVQRRCHQTLKTLFAEVDSPIDGPGKVDHGDIDIIVAIPLQPREEKETGNIVEQIAPLGEQSEDGCEDESRRSQLMASIQKALGAERSILLPTLWAATFAIPWPADLSPPLDSGGNHATPSTPEGDDEDFEGDSLSIPGQSGGLQDASRQERSCQGRRRSHIQVDIRICPSRARLEWALFKHAHGDFWNLAGSAIRPLGLTVDEEALWLRVPEIEEFHRNRAKVRLTADSAAVLEFIGFEDPSWSRTRFWAGPFPTFEDLFEYAARCRWIWVAVERARLEEGDRPACKSSNTYLTRL